MDLQSLVDAGDDKSFEKDLQSYRHFLVDSEIQKKTLCVQFCCQQPYSSGYRRKLDHVLDKLRCAAKLNLALRFMLKNIEDGKFRYFYAHENNTLLEQSKLVSNKEHMAKLKEILKKIDVIESCTKERPDTKWRFCKLTNLTILLLYLEKYRWVARMRFYLNLFQNIIQSIVSLTNRTPKNHAKTIFASSEHLLSTCMERIRDSKKKHQRHSFSFLVTVQTLTLQTSKNFPWMIIHLWKI